MLLEKVGGGCRYATLGLVLVLTFELLLKPWPIKYCLYYISEIARCKLILGMDIGWGVEMCIILNLTLV